ncbi:DUF397 domain-containing protein [Streptomyces phaeochromogenes]|uniref:DUF397 domain-containing protein n=1 Tax=Streptomyces phaeochromogenes TaxID=1923 RepID=UPI00099F0D1E|nr:DUF397 domain-containing protein [Streptomyces phaeochromogenes]
MSIARSVPEAPSSWFKSSYSNGAGGECVECAHSVDGAFVRDSKNARGPVLTIHLHAWRAFIRALDGDGPGSL